MLPKIRSSERLEPRTGDVENSRLQRRNHNPLPHDDWVHIPGPPDINFPRAGEQFKHRDRIIRSDPMVFEDRRVEVVSHSHPDLEGEFVLDSDGCHGFARRGGLRLGHREESGDEETEQREPGDWVVAEHGTIPPSPLSIEGENKKGPTLAQDRKEGPSWQEQASPSRESHHRTIIPTLSRCQGKIGTSGCFSGRGSRSVRQLRRAGRNHPFRADCRSG